MALPPAFTGESEVPNQTGLTKDNIIAFEMPNGNVRVVYEDGASIQYQEWDNVAETWGIPIDVDLTVSSHPSKFGGTMAADVDENGNIMIIWNTSTGVGSGTYSILLRADGTQVYHGVDIRALSGGVLTAKQDVVHVGSGTFSYVNTSVLRVRALDYNPGTANWTNNRELAYRASATALANIAAAASSGVLHVCWRELVGTDSIIRYIIEGGSVEDATPLYLSASSDSVTAPKLAISRTDADDVWLVARLTTATGNKPVAFRRSSGGWGSQIDLGLDTDLGSVSDQPFIWVDLENNAHVIYHDSSAASGQPSIFYRRSLGFSASWSDKAQVSTPTGSDQSRDGVVLRKEFSGGNVYVFWGDTRTGGSYTIWWSTCATCIAGPLKRFGSVVEVNRGSLTGINHLEVVIGQASVWGGGPVSRGDQDLVQSGAAGMYVVDKNYPIEATGKLASWYFYRGATSAVNIGVGELYLLIWRTVGSNIELVARVPNAEIIPAGEGLHELSAGNVSVLEGDFLGFWMAPISNSIKASRDFTLASLCIVQTNEALPAVGATVPGSPSTQDLVTTLSVRGVVIEEETILNGFAADGTGEDADGYLDFTLSTDAWADGSMNNPANLFDTNTGTYADAASGTTGNVYYNVGEIAGNPESNPPIERVEVDCTSIPADGFVRVYVSEDASVANSLAGAQAIEDWVLVAEITENWDLASSIVLHVSKKGAWIRLELVGGSALATQVNSFEVQACLGAVTDGEFPLNPTSGLKDRLFFDGDSHRHASQLPGIVDSALGTTSMVIRLIDNTPDEFFDQFDPGDGAILTLGGRGVSNRSQKVNVQLADSITKQVTITNFIGQAFAAGVYLMPLPKWFQVRAIDAGGSVVARTLWVPTIGTAQEWIRSHAIFTGDT